MQDPRETLGAEAAAELRRSLGIERSVMDMELQLEETHGQLHSSGKNRAQRRAEMRKRAKELAR